MMPCLSILPTDNAHGGLRNALLFRTGANGEPERTQIPSGPYRTGSDFPDSTLLTPMMCKG